VGDVEYGFDLQFYFFDNVLGQQHFSCEKKKN
jgi:hypothetical protein